MFPFINLHLHRDFSVMLRFISFWVLRNMYYGLLYRVKLSVTSVSYLQITLLRATCRMRKANPKTIRSDLSILTDANNLHSVVVTSWPMFLLKQSSQQTFRRILNTHLVLNSCLVKDSFSFLYMV